MISKGYKTVNFTAISMDMADIRRRSEQQRVVDLSKAIEQYGGAPIHAPTVRDGKTPRKLLCGRDRMAALMLLKRKQVEVHIVECTDEEAAELEIVENIHKRPDDRSAMIAALAKLREAFYRAQNPEDADQTIAKKVNADVAQSTGDTVRNVQRAKSQARQPVARRDASTEESQALDGHGLPVTAAQQPGEAEPSEPCLDLLGCEGDASLLELAASEQAKYDEADKHLRQAVRWVGMIEDARAQQELTAQVQRVGSLVRSARPAVLCPWCKDVPLLIKQCPGCRSIGYVSAETAKRSPRECTDLKAPVVCVNGNFYPYAEAKEWKAIPGTKNGKPQSNGKSISVETTDGRTLSGGELTVERDEDEAF